MSEHLQKQEQLISEIDSVAMQITNINMSDRGYSSLTISPLKQRLEALLKKARANGITVDLSKYRL